MVPYWTEVVENWSVDHAMVIELPLTPQDDTFWTMGADPLGTVAAVEEGEVGRSECAHRLLEERAA